MAMGPSGVRIELLGGFSVSVGGRAVRVPVDGVVEEGDSELDESMGA